MNKGKSQIALIRLIILVNSFAASAHWRRIYLLEFTIVLKLKNDKKIPAGNSNGCKWLHAENEA